MKTSIIIANYNTLYLLNKCVRSIKQNTKDYELIIIDNGSNEGGTKEFIEKNSDKFIFNETNLGFSKANNQGVEISEGDLICFLNSDTIAIKGWLEEMIKTMNKYPNCVMVGPLGNPKERKLQGITLRYQQYLGQYKNDTKVEFLSGYCLLVKSDIFKQFYFDEGFELGMFEDNLLCEKIKRLGKELYISVNSKVIHLGSSTFKKNNINYPHLLNKNQKLFENKIKELQWMKQE